MKQNKELKDIDVKIGTEDEVTWTRVKKETEKFIEDAERQLVVQRAILKLADDKIKIEQAKLKDA